MARKSAEVLFKERYPNAWISRDSQKIGRFMREVTYDVYVGDKFSGRGRTKAQAWADALKRDDTRKAVPQYSFCESATASSTSPWHIRKLTETGRKLSGGVDTASLCARVVPVSETRNGRRGLGGWDLDVAITPHHLTRACPACVTVYHKETSHGS